MREVAASTHTAHDEESNCDSKLVETRLAFLNIFTCVNGNL